MANLATLRFLGGAQTVTGSKYLFTIDEKKILVDCGLFQGLKELRLKNWDRFPIDPSTIEAVLLTHAHIDHSGYLPRLVKEGFRGKIFCTSATAELCEVMLLDAAHIQEEEAEWLNKRKLSKHSPALPLFDTQDVEKTLPLLTPQKFHHAFDVLPGVRATFLEAGHILGAAQIVLEFQGKKLAFSGDLGRPADDLFPAPNTLPEVDYLVLESTYGDRQHEVSQPKEDLCKIILETVLKKGVVLIPAFTVGRTQTLMHFLSQLRNEGRIPSIPFYINSPMATSATHIFCKYPKMHKLSLEDCHRWGQDFEYIKSVDESKTLNEKKGPMVIIAGSGMMTGGRILHHLKAFASDPHNTVVLTGFQAAGTRGRALLEGASEIKIHGQMLPVKAKVQMLENLSAHADATEILSWLSQAPRTFKKVFLTHGESSSIESLKQKIFEKFHLSCEAVHQGQEFILD